MKGFKYNNLLNFIITKKMNKFIVQYISWKLMIIFTIIQLLTILSLDKVACKIWAYLIYNTSRFRNWYKFYHIQKFVIIFSIIIYIKNVIIFILILVYAFQLIKLFLKISTLNFHFYKIQIKLKSVKLTYKIFVITIKL